MSEEFDGLSVPEIHAMIERAQTEIQRRKEKGKETLRAEIEAQLANAGLDLGELFPDAANKGTRKPRQTKAKSETKILVPKFKNHVNGDTWSGRGARPPQWVLMVLSERGWTIDQFKNSDEFLAQN